jgi:hypothetical protein
MCSGRYPNIIFRGWHPFFFQLFPNEGIVFSDIRLREKQFAGIDKILNLLDCLFGIF